MPEEVNDQTLEQSSPEQGIEESSSSWDNEILGESVEATPQEQAPVDEEHKERTRLGRRLSKFEQEFESMKSKMSVLDKLDAFMAQQQEQRYREPQRPPVEDEQLPEFITTPEEFERYQTIKRRREERESQVYASGYIGSIRQMSYVNPDLHKEIETELLTNVTSYMKHTGNPVTDANINYRLAEANLLRKKYVEAAPKPNVKGGSQLPTGVTSTTRMAAPPKNVERLDDYARKFVKAIGASEDDDWVQQSIKRKDF